MAFLRKNKDPRPNSLKDLNDHHASAYSEEVWNELSSQFIDTTVECIYFVI